MSVITWEFKVHCWIALAFIFLVSSKLFSSHDGLAVLNLYYGNPGYFKGDKLSSANLAFVEGYTLVLPLLFSFVGRFD